MNLQEIKDQTGATIFTLDSTYFDDEECRQSIKDHFHVGNLQGLGLADMDAGVAATGATLRYLTETQKTKLENLTTIEPYSIGKRLLHKEKPGADGDAAGEEPERLASLGAG